MLDRLLRRHVNDVRLVLGRLVSLKGHELIFFSVVIVAAIIYLRLPADPMCEALGSVEVVVALTSGPLRSKERRLALLPLVRMVKVFVGLVLRGRTLLVAPRGQELRHALLERLAPSLLAYHLLCLLYWRRLAQEVLEDAAVL